MKIENSYLTDYHIHSCYSPDSSADLLGICEQAVKMGLSEIAITDHAELIRNQPDELDFTAFSRQVRSLAAHYAGKLTIRLGVELGQPQDNPSQVKRYYQADALDFIIGSIHIMSDGSDPYLEDYTQVSPIDYYGLYLERLMEYAQHWDFDVLGHITYPLRYIHKQLGHTIDLVTFTDTFRALFAVLCERGRGIEINTSGYRQTCGEPYPSAQVLKIYRACGGEIITVGSDAHYAKDVGAGVCEGIELLRELGFGYIATFHNRKAQMHSI